jgi:hypothetical protein
MSKWVTRTYTYSEPADSDGNTDALSVRESIDRAKSKSDFDAGYDAGYRAGWIAGANSTRYGDEEVRKVRSAVCLNCGEGRYQSMMVDCIGDVDHVFERPA